MSEGLEKIVNDGGKVAGSVATIIGLIALLWKPIKAWLIRRKTRRLEDTKFREETLAALSVIRNDVASTSANVKALIETTYTMGADIATLQGDRLSQAHDYFMERNYCPSEKKQQLCDMYKSYRGKGYNHLAEHYEEDIIALPDRPRNVQKE